MSDYGDGNNDGNGNDGSSRPPLWHERRRWAVIVAYPGTKIERADDIADWSKETMSRECLNKMTLLDLPLHIEHNDGSRKVAGRVIRDIQTPHDTDGRRVVVVDCTIDQPGGAMLSQMLDRDTLPEGSIRHNFVWNQIGNRRVTDRRIETTEFSLVKQGLRDGCYVLAVYKGQPPTVQQLAKLIVETQNGADGRRPFRDSVAMHHQCLIQHHTASVAASAASAASSHAVTQNTSEATAAAAAQFLLFRAKRRVMQNYQQHSNT